MEFDLNLAIAVNYTRVEDNDFNDYRDELLALEVLYFKETNPAKMV